MKIVVGASSFASESDKAINLMLERGWEVVKNPYGRKMTEEETIAHLQGADGILAGLEPLNRKVLSAAPGLKAIARIGIGMDSVDQEAARELGIAVSNTPDGPTYAVAEMALAGLLACARQVIPANEDMHAGIWKKRMGKSLQGGTMLLVGYGRIAREFEKLLAPFGMNLLIYDPYAGYDEKPLEELLAKADFISLHAAGSDRILGEEQLKAIKKGAILLNSARGGLVDEKAVCAALENGTLAWYWADSFSEEPYEGPLARMENAVLTPHIATYTGLCREQMEGQAVRNLMEDLERV